MNVDDNNLAPNAQNSTDRILVRRTTTLTNVTINNDVSEIEIQHFWRLH